MEVVALIEVLDEPGMCRLPAQQLAGQRARDRVVGREEAGQEAEVPARLAGRDGDHRDVEVSPDHLGDGADRHTLVRDPVQRRSRRCLLQSQAEQVCRIEPVHGGPPAGAVADEARGSLVTRNTDRGRGVPAAAGSRPGASCSVPARPGASTTVAEAMTNGRSEPVRASPSASTARRSASTAPWKSPERIMPALNARWITPSDAPAAPRRPSRSSRSPRCTRTPTSVRAAAEASERARPVTSWPAPMSSGTRAEPIQPDAPVTKTRMPDLHLCRSPSPQRMPGPYRSWITVQTVVSILIEIKGYNSPHEEATAQAGPATAQCERGGAAPRPGTTPRGHRHTDRLSSRNALLPLLWPRRPGRVPAGRALARRRRDHRARRHNHPAARRPAALSNNRARRVPRGAARSMRRPALLRRSHRTTRNPHGREGHDARRATSKAPRRRRRHRPVHDQRLPRRCQRHPRGRTDRHAHPLGRWPRHTRSRVPAGTDRPTRQERRTRLNKRAPTGQRAGHGARRRTTGLARPAFETTRSRVRSPPPRHRHPDMARGWSRLRLRMERSCTTRSIASMIRPLRRPGSPPMNSVRERPARCHLYWMMDNTLPPGSVNHAARANPTSATPFSVFRPGVS